MQQETIGIIGTNILHACFNETDPKEILKRGYSYTLHKGKIITSTEEINVGDEITTQLFQGEITSILKDKKENG